MSADVDAHPFYRFIGLTRERILIAQGKKQEAAFQLQAGRYSRIIKGTNYHIVYCHQRYEDVSPAFDDIKDDLMLELVEAKIDPYYQDTLNELLGVELPRFSILADLFKPED